MSRGIPLLLVAAAAVVASAALLYAELGSPASSRSPARFAWFYKPPKDGTTAETIARRHEVVILTLGDERYREELREAGYEGDVLQYISLARTRAAAGASADSWCDTSFRPYRNQAAWFEGDFCEHLHPNEDWFLHNGKGERLYLEGEHGRLYAMNPGSEGWREFFAGRMRQALVGDGERGAFGYDGIFLDEIWGTLDPLEETMTNSDDRVREYESDEEWERDVVAFVDGLRADANEAGFPLWGNPAPQLERGRFSPYLDGVMVENFAASWDDEWMDADDVEVVWRQTEKDAADEKSVILVGQGSEDDEERARYAFAAYLMVADERVYFRYHDARDYRTLWWYEEFESDLGEPKGRRYRASPSVWAREFERATVLVNLSDSDADVRLSSRVVELGPRRAVILARAGHE